jgi:hypothetical protein
MVPVCEWVSVGRVCLVLRAPVGRLGKPDAEPTGGEKGQGKATSRSQRQATGPPHDCSGTGAGGARGLTGEAPHSLIAVWHRWCRARRAHPCPGDLPGMTGMQRCSPGRQGGPEGTPPEWSLLHCLQGRGEWLSSGPHGRLVLSAACLRTLEEEKRTEH